jgi:bla regulator protein BlaR1
LSYSPNAINNVITLNEFDVSKDQKPDIVVNSPVTLSNNDMFPINGSHQYLRLKMIKGNYNEDWTPGPYSGASWEGYYVIELCDEYGNIIKQTNLGDVYKEPLIFSSAFELQFDDYNNDGDIDFTIGQYSSSNGREYKLFTLRKDKKIEELPIKDHFTLFISSTTGYYSTKLTKLDGITFKIDYYDNSKGKTSNRTFRWIEKEFIVLDNN